MTVFQDPATLTPAQARALFRAGAEHPTGGWADGYAQTNLIAVPRDWAEDVREFCRRNPKPCPVLDVSEPGDPSTKLAPGADLRTDLPRYRVWRDGELTGEVTDVTELWRSDLVAFSIGCSFTFETWLRSVLIPLRHLAQGRNVSMYRTNIQCEPAGRLSGPMVVSMRYIPAERVADAVRISGAMPAVHGAPVHVGDPAELGIADLDRPDFGDAVVAEPGDVPVFWACGVTPQAALIASRPPFAITHAPGYMFLTDQRDRDYRVD
ncbi:putative hydro-lyase [Amycolatopsis panacis]|uniref:Putative hydro-lyase D5S19_00455 n=1 Tax=Amycolatopsis panacis TaxID=2340917 RepID=A0A419IBS3_9PSEU|nr:putative hydro-lyase [Amycolatopsis panacis]RJQ92478.1 putative hydro-lyase [Amycolatopsis panacis]